MNEFIYSLNQKLQENAAGELSKEGFRVWFRAWIMETTTHHSSAVFTTSVDDVADRLMFKSKNSD